MTVVDSQAGILSVEFKLAPNYKYKEHNVALFIEESVRDEESCEGLAFKNETFAFVIHSEQVLETCKTPDEETKLSHSKDVSIVYFYFHLYDELYLFRDVLT